MTRLPTLLVRLHPPTWRARYGDEMLAMLQGQPLRVREVVDLLRSAVREHLWPTVGDPRGRRAVLARLLATVLLTYAVFIVSATALLAVIQGRIQWLSPLWLTLDLGTDLFYVDYRSALFRIVTFWWAPTLAAVGIAAVCRRMVGRAREWSGVAAVLLTALVGVAVVIAANAGWSAVTDPVMLQQIWPRLLVIAVGSGALGLVTWWIGTGPMGEPLPFAPAGEDQP